MAYYTRYEKLQKCHYDGTPFEPSEYKKGEKLGVAEYSSIEECQNSSTPPTPPTPPEPENYTCCIKWRAPALNFKFNNNDITTKENPWCTKEKVSSLDFHKSKTHIESLDITVDETNNITRMYSTFAKMEYLTSVKLNIPKAASLSNISYMCAGHETLTSISFINFINFDTSHVTTANHVFDLCKYLTSLDLSNWDTSNLKYASGMFYGCVSLTSLDVSNWNTSNLEDAEAIFESCRSLTSLDLSNWDVSKVKYLTEAFAYCQSLTSLDVSNWDISNCQYFANMFYDCDSLTHIKCKQAFKDWCITNQKKIGLPDAMREGGTGTWTIVN